MTKTKRVRKRGQSQPSSNRRFSKRIKTLVAAGVGVLGLIASGIALYDKFEPMLDPGPALFNVRSIYTQASPPRLSDIKSGAHPQTAKNLELYFSSKDPHQLEVALRNEECNPRLKSLLLVTKAESLARAEKWEEAAVDLDLALAADHDNVFALELSLVVHENILTILMLSPDPPPLGAWKKVQTINKKIESLRKKLREASRLHSYVPCNRGAESAVGSTAFHRKVLSIGIDSYAKQGFANDLEYAVSDANKVAYELKIRGFNVTILENERASKTNIIQELVDEVISSEYSDEFVLYIAGHGFTDINGNQFILSHSDNGEPQFVSISLIDFILGQHKGKAYAYVDACFSNINAKIEDNLLASYPSYSHKMANILLGSQVGGYAIESNVLKSGLVTHSLVEYLREATKFSNNYVDFEMATEFITKRTHDLAQSIHGQEQHPIIWNKRDGKISVGKAMVSNDASKM